jgi:phage terminase large subunit-like protein
VPNLDAELERVKTEDPETYAQATEILKQLDELRESNPIQFFTPEPKQHIFLASDAGTKGFFGGNGSGKTTAGVIDDLIQAVDEECLPKHLRPYKHFQPPFFCRIHIPDFKRAFGGVAETLQMWVPRGQLLGGTWDSAYDKKNDVLRFSNGSKFEFTTHGQDLEQLGSVTRNRIHYDEEPPEDQRKECKARLRGEQGDELFTMTPLNGMTWTYDEIFERRHEPDRLVVEVDMDENSHLSEQAKRVMLDGLSPEEIESRKKGRFVHFGGMVLPFNEDRHLLDPIDSDHLRGQTVIVGIDPGIVRGAVVWVAFDKDDRALVFDELYPQNLDVPTVAQIIKERNDHWGIQPDYVIDPSGRNRTMVGTVGDEFAAQGIYAAPGMNGRRAGVMQMRRRLHADPPALVVTRDCTHWLWECKRWRVDEDESSDRAKTDQTGDTFKTAGPDHEMDATRYVLQMHYFGPPEQREPRPSAFTPDYEGPYRPRREQEAVGPMGLYA